MLVGIFSERQMPSSKDLEPTVPQEYILKGVVNAAVGQVRGSDDDHDDDVEDDDGDDDGHDEDDHVLARWKDLMMMMIKSCSLHGLFASDRKYHSSLQPAEYVCDVLKNWW